MRLVIALLTVVVVAASVLLIPATFDEDRSPSASWGFLETLSVLVRERDREEVLAKGEPRVLERAQAEPALIEALIVRRMTLPEVMGRVYAARSPGELVCFLEHLRRAVPGASDDERLGRHLIEVVRDWVWDAPHGHAQRQGLSRQLEGVIAELESELHAHLLEGSK
jgi:hypothetical protein